MRGKTWSQEEIDCLKECFADMSLKELQRELFKRYDVLRSETSIRVMAQRDLKLRKRKHHAQKEQAQEKFAQRITHPRPGVTVHRLL